jgi:hypothetical protein
LSANYLSVHSQIDFSSVRFLYLALSDVEMHRSGWPSSPLTLACRLTERLGNSTPHMLKGMGAVIDEQLQRGGVRLATIVNRLFSGFSHDE